jgi:hypothetical protein
MAAPLAEHASEPSSALISLSSDTPGASWSSRGCRKSGWSDSSIAAARPALLPTTNVGCTNREPGMPASA